MTYEELRLQCLKVLDLHPDSKESVDDCYLMARKMLPEYRDAYTAVLAERMSAFIASNYPYP